MNGSQLDSCFSACIEWSAPQFSWPGWKNNARKCIKNMCALSAIKKEYSLGKLHTCEKKYGNKAKCIKKYLKEFL